MPLGAVFPGDAVFVNDEPRFIGLALEMNRTGVWPATGLTGSRGVPHGPLPVWVHALLLRGWPDLEDLVLVRTLVARLLVAGAVFALALAVPALPPWGGSIALLAPFGWVYGHQLWDMALLVPLAAVAVAAYVSFCVRPRAWTLAVAAAALALAPLTHLTAVALVAAVVAHFAWAHRPWAARHPWTVGSLAAAFLAVTGPYLAKVVTAAVAVPAGMPPADPTGSVAQGLVNAATSGLWFSTWGFERYFGDAWPFRPFPGPLGVLAPAVVSYTWLSIFLVWLGGLWSVQRLLEARRSRRPIDSTEQAAIVALGLLAAQAVVGAWGRLGDSPHYQCATWPAALLLLWIGISARRGQRPIPGAFHIGVIAWGLSVAVVMGLTIAMVHRDAGNQLPAWGPALRVQVATARALAAYSPASRVRLEVPNWRNWPHALAAIREAYGLRGDPRGPRRQLVVRPAGDPMTGRLAVEEERPKKP